MANNTRRTRIFDRTMSVYYAPPVFTSKIPVHSMEFQRLMGFQILPIITGFSSNLL